MIMRVAIGIHKHDIAAAIETYNHMYGASDCFHRIALCVRSWSNLWFWLRPTCRSQKLFTHATPTLFNAGTPRPQLSSCFLMTVKEDSIEGIYDTLKQCACISKFAGGKAAHNGSSPRGCGVARPTFIIPCMTHNSYPGVQVSGSPFTTSELGKAISGAQTVPLMVLCLCCGSSMTQVGRI